MALRLLKLALLASVFGAAGCSATVSENSNITNGADVAVQEFTDANAALAAGTKFLDEDEVDRAIDVLNQAIKLDPTLAEAHFNLGVAYSLVEFREKLNAEETTGNTSNSDPKQKIRSQIAFENAAEAYEKFVKTAPENYQAFFSLGLAYNKLNEDEKAEKAFRQAVKLNPEDTLYQTELGKILIKLAQYREAIAPLKKALELDPENVEAEELLSDAEAGRSRVDYVSPKKDPGSNSSAANTTNSSTSNTRPQPGLTQTPGPKTDPSPKPAATRIPSNAPR